MACVWHDQIGDRWYIKYIATDMLRIYHRKLVFWEYNHYGAAKIHNHPYIKYCALDGVILLWLICNITDCWPIIVSNYGLRRLTDTYWERDAYVIVKNMIHFPPMRPGNHFNRYIETKLLEFEDTNNKKKSLKVKTTQLTHRLVDRCNSHEHSYLVQLQRPIDILCSK